jgi:hypothetical protein
MSTNEIRKLFAYIGCLVLGLVVLLIGWLALPAGITHSIFTWGSYVWVLITISGAPFIGDRFARCDTAKFAALVFGGAATIIFALLFLAPLGWIAALVFFLLAIVILCFSTSLAM